MCCDGHTHAESTCSLIEKPCMDVHVAFFPKVLEIYGAWLLSLWHTHGRLVGCLEDSFLWRISIGHCGVGHWALSPIWHGTLGCLHRALYFT